VINDLEWDGGELLAPHFEAMTPRLLALKREARRLDLPVIYVNDNYGQWRSDQHQLVRHCLREGVRGRAAVAPIVPDAEDYFVLKPMHSGFFATPLELLLDHLGVGTLVLTGVAGNICVLFTAHDAHMRGYRVAVPRDCIASNTVEDNEAAVRQMERVLHADTTPSPRLDLATLGASS
jgi:nicotinamidase-related amidase